MTFVLFFCNQLHQTAGTTDQELEVWSWGTPADVTSIKANRQGAFKTLHFNSTTQKAERH